MESKNEIINKTAQLAVMDEEAIKALEFLSEKLTAKDLMTFNPLVQATAELNALTELKFTSIKDDENHQEYKDAKKAIGAFNTSLREAKSELKEPYLDINRNIETISKKFGELSNNVKEQLQKEFKPFDDERERKKKEAQAKKEKALREEMEKANKEAAESKAKADKSQLLNRIKYDIIAEYKSRVLMALPELSLSALHSGFAELENFDFIALLGKNGIKVRPDLDVLDNKETEGLQMIFDDMKEFISEAYRKRIREVEQNEDLRISLGTEKRVNEIKNAPVAPLPTQAPQAPEPPSDSLDVNAEIKGMLSEMKRIEAFSNTIGLNHVVNSKQRIVLSAINQMMKKAVNYIEPKINEL